MSASSNASVPCLSLALPALPGNVGEARRRVRAFAASHGAGDEALAGIELAVSEAATNVVVHAYGGSAAGVLRIDADVEDGELELVVADDGFGFSGEPGPGLGLGLGLVRHGALALEIRDHPLGGVELWARFALAR